MHCRDTGFRTARGQLTTSEGLLRDITADLSSGQPVRRIMDEAAYTKIQQIIDGFKEVLGDEEEVEDEADEAGQVSSATEKNKDPVKKAITIKLDDLSGNSFAEFLGSISDPKWTFKTYARNAEQNRILGLLPPEELSTDQEGAGDTNVEIYEFMGSNTEASFKDTLIMSTNCEHCGYRDNEVKERESS
ncbi:hypothetical protein EDD16DRAFT_1570795 [Pisolithus croceorrhizus]|nr:hypothetical protein EDD16DRAFT_1570795 [Pisolithus croceorrhizus]